jgi:Siphovirus Gp157
MLRPQATPSPSQVREATQLMRVVAAGLKEMDATIVEDSTLFFDMIEGESGDAMDIVRGGFAAATEMSFIAEGIDAEIDRLSFRSAKLKGRAAKLLTALKSALDALGLTEFALPGGTLRKQKGRPKVIITDETLLPPQFVKTEKTPIKAAIAVALNAKVLVPGATLSNAEPTWVKR